MEEHKKFDIQPTSKIISLRDLEGSKSLKMALNDNKGKKFQQNWKNVLIKISFNVVET